MSTLHIVNKSPFSQQTLLQCLEVIGSNHSLILIEDGCYGALKSSPACEQLQRMRKEGVNLYALNDDLCARGLNNNLLDELKPISMSDMVELCCQHSNTQSWY